MNHNKPPTGLVLCMVHNMFLEKRSMCEAIAPHDHVVYACVGGPRLKLRPIPDAPEGVQPFNPETGQTATEGIATDGTPLRWIYDHWVPEDRR